MGFEKKEDVNGLLDKEGSHQPEVKTCNKRTVSLTCVWAITIVALVALFVFSLHCDDPELKDRARDVGNTFKGFLKELPNKPGCLINKDTVGVLVIHLVGGTCTILLLAVLLSLCVCHCTRNNTSTKSTVV